MWGFAKDLVAIGPFLELDMVYHTGWLIRVEFDLDVPHMLPNYSALSAKRSSAQAESLRRWKSQNQGEPGPVTNLTSHPVEGRELLNDIKKC